MHPTPRRPMPLCCAATPRVPGSLPPRRRGFARLTRATEARAAARRHPPVLAPVGSARRLTRVVSFTAALPLLATAVFGRELVDHRHDAIGLLRRDTGKLEEILTFQVDDVVQRA